MSIPEPGHVLFLSMVESEHVLICCKQHYVPLNQCLPGHWHCRHLDVCIQGGSHLEKQPCWWQMGLLLAEGLFGLSSRAFNGRILPP